MKSDKIITGYEAAAAWPAHRPANLEERYAR
jgi:hypothetical protein